MSLRPHLMSLIPKSLRRFFLLDPAIVLEIGIILGLYYSAQDYWLFSEEQVLSQPVTHPLFSSDEHFVAGSEDVFRKLTQRDRLARIEETMLAASAALHAEGVPAFLESANLIGHLRHGKRLVPWDVDADLGVVEADCSTKLGGAEGKMKLQDRLLQLYGRVSSFPESEEEEEDAKVGDGGTTEEAKPPRFEVLKFRCVCEPEVESCTDKEARVRGVVADKLSGVRVDIFAYAPVAENKLRNWQRNNTVASTTSPGMVVEDNSWWERTLDFHADYTFPVRTLLPLRNDTFGSDKSPVKIPHDPSEFLSWEYGPCVLMGPHVWPWELLLYTPVSRTLIGALILIVCTQNGRERRGSGAFCTQHRVMRKQCVMAAG